MEQKMYSKRETGHNLGKPSWNVAGIVYSTFISVYTAFIFFALYILWKKRHHTAVRIRGFWITCLAVFSIHVYVAALFIVYPLNGWYKCGSEFWYMSIIFPLGVAIFQASNIRLLSYAKTQNNLADLKFWVEKKEPLIWNVQGLKKWVRQLDLVKRTYIGIVAGIVFQIGITAFLYFSSRRFQPHGGFFGDHAGPAACRRGWEWIPSVVWQFLWVWGFGPYVLYKSRHIKDTHHWALQTRIAVIVGLPGAPMWIAFLYAGANYPTIANFNTWWPPALWFGPGLIAMQLSSVMIPWFDLRRFPNPIRPENKSEYASSTSSIRTASSLSGRKSKEYAQNWDLFEYQIRHNIDPLFWYAATKDFTAENIHFLREVRDFGRKWRRHMTTLTLGAVTLTNLIPTKQREMFDDAARIYFELVCPSTSRCYINIESKHTKVLEQMFKTVRYEPPLDFDRTGLQAFNGPTRNLAQSNEESTRSRSRDEAVAPWDSPTTSVISTPSGGSPRIDSSQHALVDVEPLQLPVSAVTTSSTNKAATNGSGLISAIHATPRAIPLVPTTIPISPKGSFSPLYPGSDCGRIIPIIRHTPFFVPQDFSIHLFDEAESSVKYLVYTNTWKSFVNDEERLSMLAVGNIRRPSDEGAIELGDGKIRRLTEIELYDMNLELRVEAAEAAAHEVATLEALPAFPSCRRPPTRNGQHVQIPKIIAHKTEEPRLQSGANQPSTERFVEPDGTELYNGVLDNPSGDPSLALPLAQVNACCAHCRMNPKAQRAERIAARVAEEKRLREEKEAEKKRVRKEAWAGFWRKFGLGRGVVDEQG